LLLLAFALGAGGAALSGTLRHTPAAAQDDVPLADLDAQRSAGPDGASRAHARTAGPSPSPAPTAPPRSVAGLSQAQTVNAWIIVDEARHRSLPRQAAVVAIATALQESNLRNLASGAVPASLKYPHEGESVNYDSIGIFQQRMSQGWGTVAQLMDPRVATGLFYNRLLKVPNWPSLSVSAAAQAVQRSAFPDAYAKHEITARKAVAALMP
jgi:hypothetical protein